MLSGASSRVSVAGVGVDFVEGDMRHFDLGRRFSLVFIGRNSLLHLLSSQDPLAALTAVNSVGRGRAERPQIVTHYVATSVTNVYSECACDDANRAGDDAILSGDLT